MPYLALDTTADLIAAPRTAAVVDSSTSHTVIRTGTDSS